MLDTTGLRALFAVAAARALETPGADQLDDLALAELIDEQLDSFDTIIHAARGTGRTAAGDALADRLWAELGIARRL